ncbi:hypothetical protein [uncultured Kiloniella sp.]|uniref:hypothetical protein n=1 Tax=uncultured Kiloniella sp. TaxID=1133091 RepID=UPI002633FD7E|nr:hypothetical protein [uncultured Kiloniella sp.]
MTDDNILDDFTVEPEHNKETLIKYLQKYPHLSNRLIELYFEFLWQRLEIDELTEEDKRQFEVLMNEISNKPNTFTTPEVEEIDFVEPSEDERGQWLEATTTYVSGLEDWCFKLLAQEKSSRTTIQSQQAEIELSNKEIKGMDALIESQSRLIGDACARIDELEGVLKIALSMKDYADSWDYKEVEDMVEAAKQALAGTGEVSPWKPIETAPKDGTQIIVFGVHFYNGPYMLIASYDNNEKAFMQSCHSPTGHDFLTHWIPLPPAPEGE